VITDDRSCDVGDGVRICYRTHGERSAEPVVLITGLGQQLNAWPTEFCDALAARGHFVVRFDNRDTGRSWRAPNRAPSAVHFMTRRWPAGQYVLADMANDTAGLIRELGLDSAHLVGLSMGAMIAQTVAARHPERVRTLTSGMSTTGARGVGGPQRSTLLRMFAPPPSDRERSIERTVAMWRHIGSHGFPFDESGVRARALESWERGGGAAARFGFARQLAAIIKSKDRTAELRKITAPTLVIHGDRDRMVDPSGAIATAKAIPGARLHTITGLGHDMPVGAWPELIELVTHHAQRLLQRSTAPRGNRALRAGAG
jgi:pimeloyl-ACP methyl ester carboxylesterase